MKKSMLGGAISHAAQVFEGKTDKQGKPYILHCLQVMQDCKSDDDDVLCAAVLHDVLEDIVDHNPMRLRFMGFSERTVELVIMLTHYPEETYQSYLEHIKTDPDAVKIKMADLRHNSQITRLKGIGPKDIERIKKYHEAYTFLTT